MVAIGTLTLFDALGAPGQLDALIVFVYLALASSGGTVPLQALPGFEPLRQILGAALAVIYFDGAGDAGLDRGLLLTSIGLLFWVVLGSAATSWYDKKGLHRTEPELLELIEASAHVSGTGAPVPLTIPGPRSGEACPLRIGHKRPSRPCE